MLDLVFFFFFLILNLGFAWVRDVNQVMFDGWNGLGLKTMCG